MRILQIANYANSAGGISVQVALLQKKLREDGFVCDLISTKGALFKRIISIVRILFRGRYYDVFHIHACSGRGFFPAVVGITIGRLLRKKIVLTYHGGGAESFFRRHPRLVCRYLSRTSANIALSGFIGKVFDEYDLPYSIIPNIIEFSENCFRKRDIIRPVFISTRSLSDTYNIDCTLRAFKTVQDKYPHATLTLLGDGPRRKALEDFAVSYGLQNVSFIGRVDNSKINDYLDKSDIMISSSRADNLPISILEGFNAGLLVIASRVGGIPYIIENKENGLLFESDNPNEMAQQMIYAVEHQDHSKQMIIEARKSLEQYRWENCKGRIMSLYNG